MSGVRYAVEAAWDGVKKSFVGDQAALEKASKRSYKKRFKQKRRVSPFVVACGFVAVFYFAYRIVLIAGPTGLINVSYLKVVADDKFTICTEEDGDFTNRAAPLYSAKYQKRIQNEPHLSGNLVVNGGLSKVDSDNVPVGFSVNTNDDNYKYQYLKDVRDNDSPFLRTVNVHNVPEGEVAGSWLIDPVKIMSGETYAYSFEYRSNIPVTIEAEYMKKGKSKYQLVTQLPPSQQWQKFTAHIHNTQYQAEFFRFLASASQAGHIDIRDLSLYRIANAHLGKGVVSVTFDDGWQSVAEDATPLLNHYQIPTTQYIISGAAENHEDGYMNFDTIKSLDQSGHEIGSHSLAHCNLTMLDDNNLERDITLSKELFEDNQIGPVTSFAYPYGQYNAKTQTAISKEFNYIRTADVGFNDRYFDPTNVHSFAVYDSTKPEEIQTMLDYASKNRVWLVLAYHRVNESGQYNVTYSQFERHLDMIKNSGLTILPVSEAARNIEL